LPIKTVAIMGVGDMGHAVGGALKESGFDVISCLNGRSEHSRNLAKVAGIRDIGNLELMVADSDIVLSIMPPSAAEGFGNDIVAAIEASGSSPMFVECNAISPDTTRRVEAGIKAAGASYTDVGIIGSAPGRPGSPPRFYASGPDLGPISELDGKGIAVRDIGGEVGRASGIKMCYASFTKGTSALQVAMFTTAEALGLSDELASELASSQAESLKRAEANVPRLPSNAGRWIGEMEEIAETFAGVGLTPDFHRAAAQVFALLDATPLAAETRESRAAERRLEDAIAIYAKALDEPDAPGT